MPHYKDGTVAKVGDLVLGPTYNEPGEVIGIVISINVNSEICNCKIKGVARVFTEEGRMLIFPDTGADYGELRAFEKLRG